MLLANHCQKENLNFGSTTLRPLYKPAKSQQSSPKPSLPCEPHLKLPRDADNLGLGDWGGGLGEEGTWDGVKQSILTEPRTLEEQLATPLYGGRSSNPTI